MSPVCDTRNQGKRKWILRCVQRTQMPTEEAPTGQRWVHLNISKNNIITAMDWNTNRCLQTWVYNNKIIKKREKKFISHLWRRIGNQSFIFENSQKRRISFFPDLAIWTILQDREEKKKKTGIYLFMEVLQANKERMKKMKFTLCESW